MTPNPKHLEILSDAVGLKVIREDEISHTVKIKDCLVAMQILQNRIDELEKENERLKEENEAYKKWNDLDDTNISTPYKGIDV